MSSSVPKVRVDEQQYDSKDVAEDGKDIKEEFKSCINETLSTVCRVASLKKKKKDSEDGEETEAQQSN